MKTGETAGGDARSSRVKRGSAYNNLWKKAAALSTQRERLGARHRMRILPIYSRLWCPSYYYFYLVRGWPKTQTHTLLCARSPDLLKVIAPFITPLGCYIVGHIRIRFCSQMSNFCCQQSWVLCSYQLCQLHCTHSLLPDAIKVTRLLN